MKHIKAPLLPKEADVLESGQQVLLSGIIYTARDQAHKRLIDLIKKNKPLPFNVKNSVIYYSGPTANSRDKVIGSCGPTTSSRMDDFTEPLLKRGVRALIGKGRRNQRVKDAIAKHKAIYFLAPSGCGALLSEKVVSKKQVAFKELGPESVYELEVKGFPLVVGIDAKGRDVYRRIREKVEVRR